MKRIIRNHIWESNSSAVHSISISEDGMEPSKLPIDDDGYILVRYGSFDSDEKLYNSQDDKLSYLITQCYYLGGYNLDREDNYHFRYVEEAICSYTGANGIKIVGGDPYINHQELPYGELNLVNECSEKSIQNFVFNKYISLETGCD